MWRKLRSGCFNRIRIRPFRISGTGSKLQMTGSASPLVWVSVTVYLYSTADDIYWWRVLIHAHNIKEAIRGLDQIGSVVVRFSPFFSPSSLFTCFPHFRFFPGSKFHQVWIPYFFLFFSLNPYLKMHHV